MEGHSDHRTDLIQLYADNTVIVSYRCRIQFFEILASSVDIIEFFNFIISSPDGGQTGGLRSHNIDTDTIIRAQGRYTWSHKFHNFIFYIAIAKYSTDDSQSHILRSYARNGGTGHIDRHNPRHMDIVSLVKQLLYQLRSTLAHGHGTESTVTGMTVRTKDHLAAAGQHLSGILVNNGLMRRYVHAAVFLGTSQTKHMVIFIDGAAHGTKRIVAVGQYVGYREFLQS